jgi:hypothetical protein
VPRKSAAPTGHIGRTESGHARDVRVERIGPVTIYKRGNTYALYYRQDGQAHRQKIDGNLAGARATAHKVGDALAEERVSPLAFTRTTPGRLSAAYLDAVAGVRKLALRTRGRYKAALDRFTDFCTSADVKTIDAVSLATVEDFVKWLRGQRRFGGGRVLRRAARPVRSIRRAGAGTHARAVRGRRVGKGTFALRSGRAQTRDDVRAVYRGPPPERGTSCRVPTRDARLGRVAGARPGLDLPGES